MIVCGCPRVGEGEGWALLTGEPYKALGLCFLLIWTLWQPYAQVQMRWIVNSGFGAWLGWWKLSCLLLAKKSRKWTFVNDYRKDKQSSILSLYVPLSSVSVGLSLCLSVCLSFLYLVVVEVEPRASCLPSKCSNTGSHSTPVFRDFHVKASKLLSFTDEETEAPGATCQTKCRFGAQKQIFPLWSDA